MNKDKVINQLLRMPPSYWPGALERILDEKGVDELVRAMEDDAGRLAYLAEYIGQRSGSATAGDRRPHTRAAKAAHRKCVAVNRAMGYLYPERRSFKL